MELNNNYLFLVLNIGRPQTAFIDCPTPNHENSDYLFVESIFAKKV